MQTIIVFAAIIVLGLSLCLMVPLIVAALGGDWVAVEGFALIAVALFLLSGGLILALYQKVQRLRRGEMFLLSVIVWLALCFVGTLPFLIIEGQMLDLAVADSVSAATTLGVTHRPENSISSAMAAYRGILGWYGGFLTLVMIIYILAPFQVGGLPNRDLRFVLHGNTSGSPKLLRTFAEIAVPYATLTFTCFLLLLMQGVRPLTAMLASLASMSTNGFLPTLSGGSIFNNYSAEITLIIFMLIGGTSIIWHKTVVNRRFDLLKEHRESMALVALVCITAILLFAFQSVLFGAGNHPTLLANFFDVAALMTTTGILHNENLGSGVPLTLAWMLAIGGATTYSTAGGISLHRLGTMLEQSINQARQLVFPHAVLANIKIGGKSLDAKNVKAVWSYFFLFILSLSIALMAFSAMGYDFAAAFSLAVGSLNSIASLVEFGLANDVEHSRQALILMTIFAFAGRVEILIIFAAIANLLRQ
ncbi:trk system potassium uptake protein TrkH [Maritalea mobilis]|uniref:Trk system potassium uptake protein TrkH n=1 Tax=Maritalea mobilis TaxID=483324 RepID=A0A4R6VQM1_9HYPH|nr:TrkH family potassium uptake protein [Maritalea mobilis]TDQ66319.1 trk system potassium uptake protein TrkH [Maritalea mobilis]